MSCAQPRRNYYEPLVGCCCIYCSSFPLANEIDHLSFAQIVFFLLNVRTATPNLTRSKKSGRHAMKNRSGWCLMRRMNGFRDILNASTASFAMGGSRS